MKKEFLFFVTETVGTTMNKVVPPGGGTSKLASSFLDACCDRKSLPTTVSSSCFLACFNALRFGAPTAEVLIVTKGARTAEQYQLQQPSLGTHNVRSTCTHRVCPTARMARSDQ